MSGFSMRDESAMISASRSQHLCGLLVTLRLDLAGDELMSLVQDGEGELDSAPVDGAC